MKKSLSLLFVCFGLLIGYTQTTCSNPSFLYFEPFEYQAASDTNYNFRLDNPGGWTGDIEDNVYSDLSTTYAAEGKFGIGFDEAGAEGSPDQGVANQVGDGRYLAYETQGDPANLTVAIVSPNIDVSTVNAATDGIEISFDWFKYAKHTGELNVYVKDNINNTWASIFSEPQYSSKTTARWNSTGAILVKDLNKVSDSADFINIKIEVIPKRNKTALGNMALDNLGVKACGDFCLPGLVTNSSITSSEFSFSFEALDGVFPVEIEYVVNKSSVAPLSGTDFIFNSDTDLVNLSTLNSNSAYNLWYRQKCDPTSLSEWKVYPFVTDPSFDFVINSGDFATTSPYCANKSDVVNYSFTSLDSSKDLVLRVLEGRFSSLDAFTHKDENNSPISKYNYPNGDSWYVVNYEENGYAKEKFVDGLVVDNYEFDSDFLFVDSNCSSRDLEIKFDSDDDKYAVCNYDPVSRKPIVIQAFVDECSGNFPNYSYNLEYDCYGINDDVYVHLEVTDMAGVTEWDLNNTAATLTSAVRVNGLGTYRVGPFNLTDDNFQIVFYAVGSDCYFATELISIAECPEANDDINNAVELSVHVSDFPDASDFTSVEYNSSIRYASPSSKYDEVSGGVNIPKVSTGNNYEDNDVWFKFLPSTKYSYINIIREDFNWSAWGQRSYTRYQDYSTERKENYAGFPEDAIINMALYKHKIGTPYSDIEEIFVYEPDSRINGEEDYEMNFLNRPRILTPKLEVANNIEYFIRVYSSGINSVFETPFKIAVAGSESYEDFQLKSAIYFDANENCDGDSSTPSVIEFPAKRNMVNNLFKVINPTSTDSNWSCVNWIDLRASNVNRGINNMMNPNWVTFKPENNSNTLKFEVTLSGDSEGRYATADIRRFKIAYYGPFKTLEEIYSMDLNEIEPIKCFMSNSSSAGADITNVFKLDVFPGDVGDYYIMGLFNLTNYTSDIFYNSFAGTDFYEGPNKGDMIFTVKDVGTRNNLDVETPVVVVDNETPIIEDCSGVDVAIDWSVSKGFSLEKVKWYDPLGNEMINFAGKDVVTISEDGSYFVLVEDTCGVFYTDNFNVSTSADTTPKADFVNNIVTSCDLSRVVFTVSGTDGAEITYDIESSDGSTVISSNNKGTLGLNGIGLFYVEIDSTERIKLKDVSVKDADGNVACSDDFTTLPDGGKLAKVNSSGIVLPTLEVIPVCASADGKIKIRGIDGYIITFNLKDSSGAVTLANESIELGADSNNSGEYIVTLPSNSVELEVIEVENGDCKKEGLNITERVLFNPEIVLPTLSSTPVCKLVDGKIKIEGTNGDIVTYSLKDSSGDLTEINQTVELGSDGNTNGEYVVTLTGNSIELVVTKVANKDCEEEGLNISEKLIFDISDVSISYSSNVFCKSTEKTSGVANVEGDISGHFTGSAGLFFIDDTTGEIDLLNSLSGDYVVTFISSGECSLSSEFELTIKEACELPQAFTPNDDGFNDVFDLTGQNVSKLEVYSRYGKLVYSKENYTNEWSGLDLNGTKLSTGTYFYLITKKDNSQFTGYVYLTR